MLKVSIFRPLTPRQNKRHRETGDFGEEYLVRGLLLNKATMSQGRGHAFIMFVVVKSLDEAELTKNDMMPHASFTQATRLFQPISLVSRMANNAASDKRWWLCLIRDRLSRDRD
jgi:hypothetical protein